MKKSAAVFAAVLILTAACRTFPEYTDDAMQYDALVYSSDWRFIVVPESIAAELPDRTRLKPSVPEYETLFRQAEVLPILSSMLLNDESPLTAADFLLECRALITELGKIDPVADQRSLRKVKAAPQVYEIRDRLIRELKAFQKELEAYQTSSDDSTT